MNYIRRLDNKIIVDGKIVNLPLITTINSILIKNFKDYKSLLHNTKVLLNIKRNVPLYINDKLILVQTSGIMSYDYFLFNYCEIYDIEINKNETTFKFIDQTKLSLSISKNRMKHIMKNLRILCDYIERNL